MAKEHAIDAMRKMSAADLQREVRLKKMAFAKHALGVHMGSEKDTSMLKKERRAIARMLTAMNEHRRADLKKGPKAATVPAHSSPDSDGPASKKRVPRKKASSSQS